MKSDTDALRLEKSPAFTPRRSPTLRQSTSGPLGSLTTPTADKPHAFINENASRARAVGSTHVTSSPGATAAPAPGSDPSSQAPPRPISCRDLVLTSPSSSRRALRRRMTSDCDKIASMHIASS